MSPPPVPPRVLRAVVLRAAVLWPAVACAAFAVACAKPNGTAPRPPRDAAVTAKDLDRAQGQPIEVILMARVPGLEAVRTPEGDIALRIRGGTSVNGNNEPLYVVDGSPVLAGPGGRLQGINPYDIETIRVLKETEASAQYGLRGVNGAIVIRTKDAKSRRP